MTQPAVYVAIRTQDLPEPYVTSQRMSCSHCAEKVWVDPLVYAPLKVRLGTVRVLCDHCVAEGEAVA